MGIIVPFLSLMAYVVTISAALSLTLRFATAHGHSGWWTKLPFVRFSPASASVVLVGFVGSVMLSLTDASYMVLLLAGFGWGALSVVAHGAVFLTWWRYTRLKQTGEVRPFRERFWLLEPGADAGESAFWAVLSFFLVLVAGLIVLTR